MPPSTESFQPTFVGFITGVADAATVIEGTMQGYLTRILDRPSQSCHDLIARSGHVFVFDEKESGIKRWTDGVQWSPSRIRDGFILYREVDAHQDLNTRQALPVTKRASMPVSSHDSDLYGSLINSYSFCIDGLMKKTTSVRLGDSCWRLVSYYKVEDVTSGRLLYPSQDQRLWFVRPDEYLRRAMGCWDLSPEVRPASHIQLDHSLWNRDFARIPGNRHEMMSTPHDLTKYEVCSGAQTQTHQM